MWYSAALVAVQLPETEGVLLEIGLFWRSEHLFACCDYPGASFYWVEKQAAQGSLRCGKSAASWGKFRPWPTL